MKHREEDQLKKFQHPTKGLIIAFNHDKPQHDTSYYRYTGPVEEVPQTLQDCVSQVENLIQVKITRKALLRSLTYPSQPNSKQVKA
jgi:hypothetical protein